MSTYYVYLDPPLGALYKSIVALWYDESASGLPSKEMSQEQIGDRLDALEAKGELVYVHDFITPLEINLLGEYKAIQPYVEQVIPRLIIARKQPGQLYRTQNCPPSYHYSAQGLTATSRYGFWLAEQISFFKRRWCAKHLASPLHPQFEWETNLGGFNREHAVLCLKHGISYEFHYKEFLQRLPHFYLRELKKFNPEFYFWRGLERTPSWWTQIFNVPFDHYLNEADKKLYRVMIEGWHNYSRVGREMIQNYPPLAGRRD